MDEENISVGGDLESLRREVEKTAGIEARTPKQFEELVEKIYSRTGYLLSPTTLKRLWGYLDEPVKPRIATLDILACFCGWADYSEFERGYSREVESGNVGSSVIRAGENIHKGERVRLFWQPSRMCLIEYLGAQNWKVIESEGTRLQPGDTFSCPLIVSGEPLYLDRLLHQDTRTGLYVIGRRTGITFQKE